MNARLCISTLPLGLHMYSSCCNMALHTCAHMHSQAGSSGFLLLFRLEALLSHAIAKAVAAVLGLLGMSNIAKYDR